MNNEKKSGSIVDLPSNSMTPYILEERQMNVTQMDVFSRLLQDRIIFVSGGVNEYMCNVIQAQLLFLESADASRDITLYINSPGGSVIHGLGIVDVMNYIKPDVATINVGMCASMGSVLLSAGAEGKRSTLVSAKVMIHQASSGTQGNVQDQAISLRETHMYNYILLKTLAKNTGQTLENMIKFSERDLWLDSDESKEFGIVDEVIIPDGSESISELRQGFNEYMESVNSKHVYKNNK